METYGADVDWYSHSRSRKSGYLMNILGNDTLNCIRFSVVLSNDTTVILQNLNAYASHELFVSRLEDEDGNTSFEFKNKLEQTLLVRQVLKDEEKYTICDTYYIYDDFGNLAVVLQPKASDTIIERSSVSYDSTICSALRDLLISISMIPTITALQREYLVVIGFIISMTKRIV